MWAIQLGLIDAGGSTHNLSVLLSAVKTGLRMHTALEIAHVFVCYVRVVFILLRAPDCVATIQEWRLFEGGV